MEQEPRLTVQQNEGGENALQRQLFDSCAIVNKNVQQGVQNFFRQNCFVYYNSLRATNFEEVAVASHSR